MKTISYILKGIIFYTSLLSTALLALVFIVDCLNFRALIVLTGILLIIGPLTYESLSARDIYVITFYKYWKKWFK